MHHPPKHRIHYPLFEIVPLDAGDGAVVFHSEQDATPLQVGERHHLPRQLLRPQIIPLELHSRVLAASYQFEKFRSFHRTAPQSTVSLFRSDAAGDI